MSAYRNYTTWNKSNLNPTFSGSSSSKSESTSSKYDSSYGRPTTDSKKLSDSSLRIGQKYGTYSSTYQKEEPSTKERGRSLSSIGIAQRLKETLEKKDSSHPPVSYRSIATKSGTKSRDTSIERENTDKSLLSPNSYSRLYPSSYSTRSISRERTEPISSAVSTIPKYTGRSSITKDDKFNLTRTSRNESREDLTALKLKSVSRATSREDLDSIPKKYITSRFLPKNTIEKSQTAYSRPASSRLISSQRETSRKNREILHLLSAQNDSSRSSRSVSRCPSSERRYASDNQDVKSVVANIKNTSPKVTVKETKTDSVNVVDRKTDNTKQTEKLSARVKSTDILATPWSSYLDLKFSSPKSRNSKDISNLRESLISSNLNKSHSSSTNPTTSSKSISSNNVSKSTTNSQSNSASKIKSPTLSFKYGSNNKQSLPKNSSSTILNKDFRKSVLNMNSDHNVKKSSRSNSISSAESEADIPLSEATDVSENLSSCKSFHKSSSISKLPKKATNDLAERRPSRSVTRSPSVSSESNLSVAASEDDLKLKSKLSKNSVTYNQKINDREFSKTPTGIPSLDDSNTDKSPKPPMSPRVKIDSVRSDAEAKSFLIKALTPPTNLYKIKQQNSSDKLNWMDDSLENISEISKDHSGSKSKSHHLENDEKIINRVKSGEQTKWINQNLEKSDSRSSCSNKNLKKDKQLVNNYNENADQSEKSKIAVGQKFIPRVESGEKPWWQDEAAQVPDGVEVYTVDNLDKCGNPVKEVFIRHLDSGEKPWWLDESADVPEGVQIYSPVNKSSDANSKSFDYLKSNKIRHIDSGERAWWLSSNENIPDKTSSHEEPKNGQMYRLIHQGSGKTGWWLSSDESRKNSQEKDDTDSEEDNALLLGDRASPEGLEMPKEIEQNRITRYDNNHQGKKRPDSLFISRHKNIDDILGTSSHCLSPLMSKILFNYIDDEEYEEITPDQVTIHESNSSIGIVRANRSAAGELSNTHSSAKQLDDASLQLYKDGDYGSYLDLEASISEQQEEFEGFQSNKKNSIVLRTQLSVRVHTIIEKLLTSEGRELRRALFSLKQIFQEDKDLVHEFVQNDGLACLIKVGSEADQNYQNYILRALGQVMLYVDGMNGVIHHNETVQWLYSLISSKFRLVVKTALKLLLVFVEYVDSNCMLLIKAVQNVDCLQGFQPWFNIMRLLKDFDSADTELLIYAMTLINKCFNGIPDQDTYYDQADALEEQGIEGIIQRYMSKPGTDLDLLQQFQIYEAVLQYEDSEEKGIPLRHLDESVRKTLRSRKSVVVSSERRKSRRHSTGNTSFNSSLNIRKKMELTSNAEDDESSSSQSSAGPNDIHINGSYKENNKANEVGVTPALKRRRERAERQRSFMREQQESATLYREINNQNEERNDIINGNYTNSLQQRLSNGNLLHKAPSRKDLTPLMNAVNKLDSEENGLTKQPWILSMMYNNNSNDDPNQENVDDANENDRKILLQLKRENTVKDLTQKLANQTGLHSPSEENKINRIGDMSGLISKAKEGLAKSKSKADVLKSPTSENVPKAEIKKSENELRWEELVNSLNRPLNLCDLDFTDLMSDDENDILAPVATTNGIPPPPPPLISDMMAPPPPPLNNRIPSLVPNPPVFGLNLNSAKCKQSESKIPIKKNKKTVKLFWKEVRDDAITSIKLKTGLIWDELTPVSVDTQKLEHLFESRAKDLITKKQQEMNKNKEIIVLDPKRSNAINIGMTKLPPPRSIKTAILKMDATIMNREGIEKLLTMLPTEEERSRIQDAQASHPDLPLGSAEQFLLTLASISELPARLNLWAFKLDFENSEREIAEPLMDLKQGFEVLKINKSFRSILGTLLSIGIFLNGAEVKGFQIEYLAKVPEVKDTVHKHSLLHHLCHIVMEKFPDSTDLYSEIGAITRASKIDFDELALNIQRLETDCKASWDHLKLIAKHDGSTMMKVKMSDFLADCAERIILLSIIHRRVTNRFHRFLLWLGIPLHQITDTKPNEFCRIVSEFALEYRTTRERVLQQLEKKANHRERNKTRGKMITEIGKFRTKEDRADAELRQLLGSDMSDVESLQGTLTWRRRSRDTNRSFLSPANGNLTDGDDEILESLVKTATKGPSRTAPRERKRTRHADRKSLRRTLKNGLSEEEKKHLSAYIKSY